MGTKNQNINFNTNTNSVTGAGNLAITQNTTVTFTLRSPNSGATLAGIKLGAGSSAGSTIYPASGSSTGPFSSIGLSSDKKVLTMLDTDSGNTTWSYCIGVYEDSSSTSYWDDPKIYNRTG